MRNRWYEHRYAKANSTLHFSANYIRLLMRYVLLFIVVIFCSGYAALAQHQVSVISRCGGSDLVTIPSIVDRDQDGMDDRLEQKLLQQFIPKIIQFSDESCPGPALDGSGDTNMIVCHIYPIPQQYTRSGSYDSIMVHPVAVVPAHRLVPGLIWYYPKVKVNCAVLYGQDCGALGHTADVEGFNFSLRYMGPDTVAGWMYDTIMSHWAGDTIQTVSHAGTLCQHVEVRPMKSLYVSWGADSVYASPDKHGNYLTIGGCGSSFICNPGCGATRQLKHVRAVNIGEPAASLVSDLGSIYPAYAGNDPWSTTNFLDAQGGNAGAIRDKMLLPLSATFINGHPLTAAEICPLYKRCYGQPAYTYNDQSCAGVPYTFRSRVLTQSGVYRDTIPDAYGCDSIVTLTLTVLPRDTTSSVATICAGSNYLFHGVPLSAPGTYMDTLTDRYGCDSMVRLTLVVYPAAGAAPHVVTCGTPYPFGGSILTSSGVYTDTLADVHGCDSVVSLTLVIDTPATIVWSLSTDTVMAHTHPILLVVSPSGGTFSGDGVSGNLFYVDSVVPGTHIISYSYTDAYSCSVTSSKQIVVLWPNGIEAVGASANVFLYPNPVADKLLIQSSNFHYAVALSVYDAAGQLIAVPFSNVGSQLVLDCGGLTKGVYMVRFNSGSEVSCRYFVKGE